MEILRTFDLLNLYRNEFRQKITFAKKENGKWIEYTGEEYIENVNNVSYGLLALGFKKGDKIASISNNRPEWNFIDMGMSQIGCVHVPIYPTITNEEYIHILNHSESRIVIVSDRSLYNKIKDMLPQLPNIEKIYTFNKIENLSNWMEIVELGKQSAVYYAPEVEKIKATIIPEDLFTLIYTSGTTGVSKGVMLSHKNMMSNVCASAKRLHLNSTHKALSFLPLCHVFERMTGYIYQLNGVAIHYAEGLGTIADNLRELKVDAFITVPRLLETIYDKIIDKANHLTGIKKTVFYWALRLGLRYDIRNKNWWYAKKLALADKLVFSKWREALGGNVIFLGIGGAALQPRLERVFWAAKIPIFQGYGLTETSPIISVNYSFGEHIKFGTTGPILEGVTVKIADDGEILVKGPNVMMGYYKNPELNNEVFDNEGWFHTGDIGIIEEGRFIKITDRKKEIFKTSNGKYIAPQSIENRFKESQLVQQIMIVGENEKFVSAIISPNFDFLINWCERHKIHFSDTNELVSIPKVLEHFQKEISSINKSLGQWEQIKKFKLVCEEWSQMTGELSPTLKLKRKFIIAKYKHILEKIYIESEKHVRPEKLTQLLKSR